MPDPRRRLPAVIAAFSLAVGVVVLGILASPISALALLSLVVGFVTHIVLDNPYRNGP